MLIKVICHCKLGLSMKTEKRSLTNHYETHLKDKCNDTYKKISGLEVSCSRQEMKICQHICFREIFPKPIKQESAFLFKKKIPSFSFIILQFSLRKRPCPGYM